MDDDRLERLERRLDDLDQRNTTLERTVERAVDRSRQAGNTVFPTETRRHKRAAWRESLHAMRSFIDFWAERLNDQPDGQQKTDAPTGRENIPID